MQFNSVEYGLFLPLAVLLYYAIPPASRWIALVAASTAFISWTGPVHVVYALGLAAINYVLGIEIEKHAESRRGPWLLYAALLCNVGVLVLFKYGSVIAAGFYEAADGLGTPPIAPEWALLLPLGVSYYVFQLISYQLEIYWGRGMATRHPGHFMASILFFPKFVAGPIERPHHFMPQLVKPRPFSADDITAGLKQIAWGLFKKAVIADRIALIIDPIYQSPQEYSPIVLAVAIALYMVQIYNDFSGYTDMALGSARVLGIEIIPNFARPFSARTITEFWRRWHISLSSWTNDYIFRPLSTYFSFKTSWHKTGLSLSIILSFLVLGVWHGPSLNFALFGLIHGCAVAFEALTQKQRARVLAKLPERLADRMMNVLTVVFYASSCVFFRAESPGDAVYILWHAYTGVGSMALGDLGVLYAQRHQLAILFGVGVVYAAVRAVARDRPLDAWLSAMPTWSRWSVYYAIVLGIVLLGNFDVQEFVYVQF